MDEFDELVWKESNAVWGMKLQDSGKWQIVSDDGYKQDCKKKKKSRDVSYSRYICK